MKCYLEFFGSKSKRFLQANCLVSILQKWQWDMFSLIYSDGGNPGDVAKHLLRNTRAKKVTAAVIAPIPLHVRTVVIAKIR